MKVWYNRRRNKHFLDYWEKGWIIRESDRERREEEELAREMAEAADDVEALIAEMEMNESLELE